MHIWLNSFTGVLVLSLLHACLIAFMHKYMQFLSSMFLCFYACFIAFVHKRMQFWCCMFVSFYSCLIAFLHGSMDLLYCLIISMPLCCLHVFLFHVDFWMHIVRTMFCKKMDDDCNSSRKYGIFLGIIYFCCSLEACPLLTVSSSFLHALLMLNSKFKHRLLRLERFWLDLKFVLLFHFHLPQNLSYFHDIYRKSAHCNKNMQIKTCKQIKTCNSNHESKSKHANQIM